MNAAEKARLAKEKEEQEKRQKQEEIRKKKQEDRERAQEFWAKIIETSWSWATILILAGMLIFGILMFCTPQFSVSFWIACIFGVLSIAQMIWGGVTNKMGDEKACGLFAMSMIAGFVYLLLVFARAIGIA